MTETYLAQSPVTDPGAYASWVAELPSDVSALRDDETPASAHVDFATRHRDAETERHVRAGAEVVKAFRHWTVMRDPVVRIYCLTDRDPATRTPY